MGRKGKWTRGPVEAELMESGDFDITAPDGPLDTMKIYLDDIRTAPDATWTVCRNGDEFRASVRKWAWSDDNDNDLTVSFDHDLGDDSPDTGHTLVKWLCEYLAPMMGNMGILTVVVHSANPVGAKNIRDYWEWYAGFLETAACR